MTGERGSVNVTEFLASRGLLPVTDEERAAAAAAVAAGWDSMAAYIKRSSDEQIRARHPGIGDEDIARWRRQAADLAPLKRAGDFWYTQPGAGDEGAAS
jgi:hypothetical protein